MDCANGASQYLFYGGIIIIATNVVGVLAGCARQAALKVGYWDFSLLADNLCSGWEDFMWRELWPLCSQPSGGSAGDSCFGHSYLGR